MTRPRSWLARGAALLVGAALGCAGPRPSAVAPDVRAPAGEVVDVEAAAGAPVERLEVERRACTRGHALSCLRAAVLLDARAVAEPAGAAAATHQEAMSLRLSGCERGLRAACYSAAVQLRTQRGVARDEDLAGTLTQLSCSDGLCGARFEDLIADFESTGYTTLSNDWLSTRVALPGAALRLAEVALVVNHRDVVATEPWSVTCAAVRDGAPVELSVQLPRFPLEYEAVQVWSTLVTVDAAVTLGDCYAQYPTNWLESSRVWVGARAAGGTRAR